MRLITLRNEDGVALSLSDTGFTGRFALADADGLYEVAGNVQTSENSMTDGSAYLGSTQRARNIVLTLYDTVNGDHEGARSVLYNVFPLKKPGILTYTEDRETRRIPYYVENINSDGQRPARCYTISLICPDPFFEDADERQATNSGVNGGIEWPVEFLAAGIEFGVISNDSIEIMNNTGGDSVGFTAVFAATGTVSNPALTRMQTGEIMAFSGVQLNAGDYLTVTTYPGNMHAILSSSGIDTDVTASMTFESEFLRLAFGANTFEISADTGSDSLNVTVYYRYKYPAV